MRSLKGEDRAQSTHVTVADVPLVLLMVADGHGGGAAAQRAHECVLSLIVDEAEALGDASAESLRTACSRAFRLLNADVLSTCGTAGATLTVVVWNASRGELTVAHAGDSSAMLVRDETIETITAEHRLSDSSEERDRVIAQGLKLARAANAEGLPSGPIRAWPGGLAVCRTIGDADCAAASAEPEVRTLTLDLSSASGGGAAVVVASDGVWDALSVDKVARYVRESGGAAEAAERVVAKAYKARPRDDVSAAAAWLGSPPWAVHSPSGGGGGGIGGLIGGLRTRVRKISSSAIPSFSGSPSSSPASSPSSSPVSSPMASRLTPLGTPMPSALDLSAFNDLALLPVREEADAGGSHDSGRSGSSSWLAPLPSSGSPSSILAECSGGERQLSPARRTATRVALPVAL